MNNYYVLRLGSVFRIIYMDESSALAWTRGGWEVRLCATNPEAQAVMEKWKNNLPERRTLRVVSRQAS
jgi:hypothetical protein